MAVGNLAGGRGLGPHLDYTTAAPGGQSGHWLISGTGPRCAALQEEVWTSQIQALWGFPRFCDSPVCGINLLRLFQSGFSSHLMSHLQFLPPSSLRERSAETHRLGLQLLLHPSSCVSLEKMVTLSPSIQHHWLAASPPGLCWLHNQERKSGPRTAPQSRW